MERFNRRHAIGISEPARVISAIEQVVSAASISAADYGKFFVTMLNDEHVLKQLTASPVTVDSSLNLSWGIERVKDNLYIWQ